MPEGPVVLLSETAEIDTSWWRFDGAWARSNLGDGHSGDWSFAAYPGSLYPAGIVAALSLSQPLSLPPGTRVELKYWQRLDVAGGDSAQVQVSSDNANWVTVVSETAVRNFAWTVRTVQLDSYAGQLIWLRFVLSSDADPTTVGDGWWLDDITVWAEPLPVMSRLGLSSYDSDDLSLWLAEGSWQAVGAPVHSGGLAWTAAPQPNTATALTLNADISLTGMNAPELRFWHQLNLASGEDRAQVELSTDGGQTWQPIVLYPGMTTASDWNGQIISLAAYTGQTVRIRFLLVLGSSGPHGASWAIDTIQVQSRAGQLPATFAVTDTPVPSPGTTAMTATLSPMPEVAGWATYADTDPMLQYGRGSWQTFHVAAAVGGTLTGTADREATLTVQFQGTGIRVIYSKGPEGQILVGQVDDGHSQADNTHSPHYSYGHSLTFDGLSADHHVLRVTNGWGAIWIEAIEVQGTLLPSNAGVSPVAAIPTAVAAPPLEPSGDIGINAVTSIEAAGTYEIIEGAGNGTFSLEVLDGGLTMHAVYAAPEGWWRSQSSRWDIATINGPVSTVILEVTGPAIPMNDWTDDCPAVGTWMPRFNPYDIWPSQVLPIEGGYRYVYYMNQTITGIGGYANTYRACPKQLPTPKTYDWTVRIIEVNGVPQITPTSTPTLTPTPTPTFTSTPTPSPTTQPVCIVEVTAPKNWYPHPAPARTERFGLVPDPYTTPIGVFQVGDQLELDARYFRGVASEPSFETFIYRVKKVNGIDVGSEAWINTNHGLTGINTVNCESPYLDLQVQPRNSREAVLENIRDYGVDVQATVSDGSIIIPQGLSEPWSLQELESILDGIELVAGAFGHYSTIKPPQTLFRGVMTPAEPDYFMFRRISGAQCEVAGENRVVVDCGYMQNPPIPSSGPHWTPNGLLTSEAAIHEMGHVFDIRTSMYLRSQVSGASVLDCRQVISNAVPFVVFGNSGEGWIRGQNGWGDSALNASGTAQISQFQQNPAAEDYETAADTFLNWVYRRTSDSTAISLNLDDACIISDTGKWLGFQNINKQNEPEIYQDSQGSNHNARSGNRRYVWMHIIIEGVFNGNTN